MPNFQIIQACNRKCPYCFAEDLIGSNSVSTNKLMSLETVNKSLDYLQKFQKRSFSIIGGEPTLHPDFQEIVRLALNREMNVFLFTNGVMKKNIAEFLAGIEEERLGILMNVNDLGTYSEKEIGMLCNTLSLLGQKTSFGFNIYQPGFDLTFLVELIEKYQCKKFIRLGLAQPIYRGKNIYARIEDYKEIAENIVRQAAACDEKDIIVGFDCGFVQCMFTPEQLGWLKLFRAETSFACEPVFDVGPNLEAWSCFALSNWNKLNVLNFDKPEDVEEHYKKQQLLYKWSGIFAECFDCKYIARGQCSGGCISHTISSFEKTKLQ